ncbi:BgTH12-02573 [Blumeria graminis f. sp. triticale]|uniref:BgTH12-02573 n=1 Tax=Blumeria graminis f. sp. triticale TaxID=1689686 RepID=A0A9W4GET7_BLUGR|nr:BgTH12-02573 [Blumeria graminis f. sp. triticale]
MHRILKIKHVQAVSTELLYMIKVSSEPRISSILAVLASMIGGFTAFPSTKDVTESDDHCNQQHIIFVKNSLNILHHPRSFCGTNDK